MQKGYKREAKGMAILRCFIGLFIVVVIVLLVSFALRLDYSDKLDPAASIRPYVETTPAPSQSPDANAVIADISGAKPSATATAVPTPTPRPTPTPKPTPKPTPTVAPTSIPETAFSALRTDLTFPENPTTDIAKLGLTHSYLSVADDDTVMQLQGYAYIEDAAFDGATAQCYLVLKRESTGDRAVVLARMDEGISGVEHETVCVNAANTDFEVVLSAKQLPEDIYSLGMVIQYKIEGADRFEYAEYPESCTFTVLSGKFLKEVALTD